MSSLNRIDTSRAKATSRPGSKEWCELLEERALDRVIATVAAGSPSPGDVVHLLKIKKGLLERAGKRRKVTWLDPEHWKSPPLKPA